MSPIYKKFQKIGAFVNITTKVLKNSSDISNSALEDLWNYEILGKKYFHKNLKPADITPVYTKQDTALVEKYQPTSVLPCIFLKPFKE